MSTESSKEKINKTLDKDFVANANDTWLRYCLDLLQLAKFHLGLDDLGRIMFVPDQTIDELQPKWTYNDDNSSILYPEMSIQHDLYGIPNVVEVICSSGTNIYNIRVENNDPTSPTSIQQRGREIIYRDTSPSLPGYPTEQQVQEYAETLLKKLSSVEYQITYTHGYCPVKVGDCVRLNYNKAGLTDIKAKVIELLCKENFKTFKVHTKRADKRFEIHSMDFNNIIGILIVKKYVSLFTSFFIGRFIKVK